MNRAAADSTVQVSPETLGPSRVAGGRLWTLQAKYAPYLFVSPFVLLFVAFMVYPLARSIILSFHKTAAGPQYMEFIGLDNYRFLVRDKAFQAAVRNTTLYTAFYLMIQIPASLGLAILLNNR